jgi:uncharacterized protein (TIGR00730 family)
MKVSVFCSSSPTIDKKHIQLAADLGAGIAARSWTLVSGGGKISSMGAVARAARAGGAKTIGVIPDALVKIEFADHDSDTLHVVKDMRERKGLIEELSDAFVVLPGGAGTLEELFEIWVGRYLKFHNKPIAILDPFDLYKPLLDLVNHLEAENFVKPGMQELIYWARSVDEALNHIAGK